MSTAQESVITVTPFMQETVEPLMWGRDPVTPGPLSEWFQMYGLGNQDFPYLFAQDADTMNNLMSSGVETGKTEMNVNERAFQAMTLQNKGSESSADAKNPFANLTMGNRVSEANQTSAVGSGTRARSRGGRGRGRGSSKALVPHRGGVVASPLQTVAGSGRFTFH